MPRTRRKARAKEEDIGGERIRKKKTLNKQIRDTGGERIRKKKSLNKQIRDIKRLLTKVQVTL